MSVYKRGKVWWARAQVAGHEYRISLRTASRQEAVQRYEAWRKELINRAHFGIQRHTWEEAVVEWGKTVLHQELGPSTAQRYLVSLKSVRHLLDGMYVDEIDRKTLNKLLTRHGVTASTKNRDLTAVMSVIKACERWGWIDTLPQPPRARERRLPISLPTDAQVTKLIAECAGTGGTLHHLVKILRLTGMRLEEAGPLTWRQVDLNRRAIMITEAKWNIARAVPLCDSAVGTLRAIPRRLDVPLVFWHGEDGKRYANLSSRLRVLAARAGFANRIHDLRHLFAVEYMRAGGSLYDLQRILGHRSIRTTEIYLDFLTPEERSRAIAAQKSHIV